METVTISSKYQLVIPRSVRERMGIRPGQLVQIIPYEDRIEVVPVQSAREIRGFLGDLENTFERDDDRL
ncbi:MAG: AbrB/MazE/SpoVT family DNA-binding domain-containing protein [Gammaproteobacteria bacterium]|nr:AbrB/MazE/SpoVT family DNA-binding domain-containing protein [Gammaproteobacteria bacterium]